MEVEEEEFGELCAENLENWTSPIYSDLAYPSLHQNPFSLHHHQPLNTAYDAQTVKEQLDTKYSIVSNVPQLSLHARQPNQEVLCCTNLGPKVSMSKPKYEDPKQDFELEHKGDKIMKALKPTNNKGSKHEKAEESNNNRGIDRPIIPVLVADTFFDKLLGRSVDGIDVAALSNVKEAKACQNDAEASTVSAKSEKEIEKLNSGHISSWVKCNFPTANRMPKRSPISDEYRRMPATSTAVPTQIRSSFSGLVAKSRFMLPSNKTIFDINIDDFGEKMWRNPEVDMSDFFNYGFDEKQWKDYCKLMQVQIEVRRCGQSKRTADANRRSFKDGAIGEVKFDRGNDERIAFRDSKDPSFCISDVIIEMAMPDSSHENEIIREQTKENGVLRNDGGANLLSNSGNTTYINCRMINGDKILPLRMDSYSAEYRSGDRREWKKEQTQKFYDAHLTKSSRKKKTDVLITHSQVELTGSNEIGKQQSSRKQRENSLGHVGQRSQKRVMFHPGNQTSNHKLDLNLAEPSSSPRVESVREKKENYVADGVQKQSASRIIPTNSHNSEIKNES